MDTLEVTGMKPVETAPHRPAKYTDITLLQKDIDSYFTECDKLEKVYTFAGLARKLGITRSTFFEWSNNDREFITTLKDAMSRVIENVETLLLSKSSGQVGLIFWLKNIGKESWVDKQEIVNTGNEQLVVNILSYRDTDKYMKVTDTTSKLLK